MSRKAYVPSTYVMGASPVIVFDEKSGRNSIAVCESTMMQKGHGDTPYYRQGAPMWRKPKPQAVTMHFKTEADKRKATRRAMEHFEIAMSRLTRQQVLSVATPNEVHNVPQYRGISCRLANEIRYTKRRIEMLKARKNEGKSKVQIALESLGLGDHRPEIGHA